MNCNEFKEKVADLFDKNTDIDTQQECNKHMGNCPECKAYYDELQEAFNTLQPQKVANTTKAKKTHRLWRYAAAAAIFLFGFFIGLSHLFSTPAVAEDARITFLQQGIQSVQNVGSFQMEVYARTTPQENFAYFDPTMPFVKTDIQLLRQNDSLFYRVEKKDGRAVVLNGTTQFLWVPGKLYLKGNRETNFLERFANLMFPERLLTLQKSAVALSKENKVTKTETDTTVVLTVEGTEKYSDLKQLFETGEMDDCHVIVENTFTKNDGLLRFVKLWIIKDGRKTLLLHIDNIRYNVILSKRDITLLPAAKWTNVTEQHPTSDNRLKLLQNETAEQAAERILNALITDNESQANEALIYYKTDFENLSTAMKGCKATDFQIREEPSYAGVHVFYTLTTTDGKQIKRHIALRNDNEQHIWIVDGGL
ncbi:anti-sigma factor family protein [Hallella bergensis]|uniref:anti-sigma factor family protein n=1 Tax=Hallella bergensis TaxID=242750 RepID=UPI003990DE60